MSCPSSANLVASLSMLLLARRQECNARYRATFHSPFQPQRVDEQPEQSGCHTHSYSSQLALTTPTPSEYFMQLDKLLRTAVRRKEEARDGSKPEKTLEVAQLSKLWAACKDKRPPLEWFPPPLRQSWQWIPTAVEGSTQNVLLLFHGLGDTPGTISGGVEKRRC